MHNIYEYRLDNRKYCCYPQIGVSTDNSCNYRESMLMLGPALRTSDDQYSYSDEYESEDCEDVVKSLTNAELRMLPICHAELLPASNETCQICLEFIIRDKKGGFLFKMLPCFHSFHISCINQWLARSSICPICRLDVKKFLINDHQVMNADPFNTQTNYANGCRILSVFKQTMKQVYFELINLL